MNYRVLVSLCILYSFVLKAQKTVIPFHINECDRIILHHTLNRRTVNLCFDSAIPFNILDKSVAQSIDFAKSNNSKADSITTVGNINIGVFNYVGIRSARLDNIFWGAWMNSDMRITEKKLDLGTNIDGIVGYNNDYFIELDFVNNKMLIWDSLPFGYLKNSKIYVSKLVNSDFGGTFIGRIGVNELCLKTNLVVLDTVELAVNMLIDTGSQMYLNLEVFDKSLLESLIQFRKMKNQLNNTIKLKIPDLQIDTSFNRIRVLPQLNPNVINPYRSAIGGLLGVAFLKQYKRVILNKRMQLAWFEK